MAAIGDTSVEQTLSLLSRDERLKGSSMECQSELGRTAVDAFIQAFLEVNARSLMFSHYSPQAQLSCLGIGTGKPFSLFS